MCLRNPPLPVAAFPITTKRVMAVWKEPPPALPSLIDHTVFLSVDDEIALLIAAATDEWIFEGHYSAPGPSKSSCFFAAGRASRGWRGLRHFLNWRRESARRYQHKREAEKQSNRSLHRDVLRNTAWSSFMNAVMRISAVTPSACGVINQTAVVNPIGIRADNVFPLS